jgi:hypothetical protein
MSAIVVLPWLSHSDTAAALDRGLPPPVGMLPVFSLLCTCLHNELQATSSIVPYVS